MPLRFHCVCGQALIVSRKFVGKSVHCPKCNAKLRVPGADAREPIANQTVSAPLAVRPPGVVDTETDAGQRTRRWELKSAAEKSAIPFPATPSPPSVPVNPEVTFLSVPPPTATPDREPLPGPIQSLTTDHEQDHASAAPVADATNVMKSSLIRGYEPRIREVSTVKLLAGSLAVVAFAGAAPAFYDLVEHLQTAESVGVATWAYMAFLAALIQTVYAIYLWQLPDWSSVWVVTIVTLLFAVAYAMLLGVTYLSSDDGWLVQLLQLSDKLRGGRAAGWCFIMLSLTSLFSYLSGRVSVRWQRAL